MNKRKRLLVEIEEPALGKTNNGYGKPKDSENSPYPPVAHST
jgi:hypothetical protein